MRRPRLTRSAGTVPGKPLLEWRVQASLDLIRIVTTIADDNIDAAQALKDEIEAKAARLPEHPPALQGVRPGPGVARNGRSRQLHRALSGDSATCGDRQRGACTSAMAMNSGAGGLALTVAKIVEFDLAPTMLHISARLAMLTRLSPLMNPPRTR